MGRIYLWEGRGGVIEAGWSYWVLCIKDILGTSRFVSMTKLKVFRTAVGFHDAYVAAPSQKNPHGRLGAPMLIYLHAVLLRKSKIQN